MDRRLRGGRPARRRTFGQVVVLAFATAVLNAGPAAGTSRLGGYAMTFSLLLVPTLLAAVLAVRSRRDVPG
ncbi:hypothetical protein ACF07L_16030 [Streptomyces anulatus]|uniref:hypothetical protein n=1 Tax=Streptomyces anulatus TaxID=1892 RepID=UPI0036FA6A38